MASRVPSGEHRADEGPATHRCRRGPRPATCPSMRLRLAPRALSEAKRKKTWWQKNRPTEARSSEERCLDRVQGDADEHCPTNAFDVNFSMLDLLVPFLVGVVTPSSPDLERPRQHRSRVRGRHTPFPEMHTVPSSNTARS